MLKYLKDSTCLLFYFLIGINLASSQTCYDTGNFTTNSTYDKNRGLLLSSLASNVNQASGRFYNTTVGQDPDKVYGLVLCRPDTSPEDCSSCVNSGIKDITAGCPNQKEAILWGGRLKCVVRYSNRSIFEKLELDPYFSGYNTGKLTVDLQKFDNIWESLVGNLITKASVESSNVKYASGEATLTLFQTIYALMQCTPDISQSDCHECLRQSAVEYQTCCHGYQGVFVGRPSCFFRWDLYPIYEPMPEAPFPSPSTNTTTTNQKENGSITSTTIVIIVIASVIFVTVVVAFSCTLFRRRKPKQDVEDFEERSSGTECLQFDFKTIKVATSNFSDDNNLGQGRFGAVYKGTLSNGQLIAVKRLSRNSEQGEVEFKNVVRLMARLEHRNLVRLLGFCLDGNERLLVYEFLPNSSLDHFIFDPNKRLLLDWNIRCKIILGIAQGMLYLHEDSQLRIVHRDLKPGNILLDDDMNSKISGFGMAKLFETDQSQDPTSRVVGTFDYMAPEYAMHGRFSVKSDIFSFGVLVLEIITGRKNNSFNNGDVQDNLLTYAWKSWNEGTALNLIDPILSGDASRRNMLRFIHIGLLCVQEKVVQRPTMASIILMLSSSSLVLPLPSRPAFFMHTTTHTESTRSSQYKSAPSQFSTNEASVTELDCP